MTDHPCPYCGGEPTAQSLAKQHLSDLAYVHDDRFLTCDDCGEQWTVGIPKGDCPNEEWNCPCGGDFIPHFCYIRDDDTMEIRPKCQSCYYVPDVPIVRDITERGNGGRVFIGHHTITGNTDDAIELE